MGIYINPPDMTKEEFLEKHGELLTDPTTIDIDNDRSKVVVCLIDHYGQHTAAGIAYSNRERDAFIHGTRDRETRWYTISPHDIGEDAGLPKEYPDKWATDLDYWGI